MILCGELPMPFRAIARAVLRVAHQLQASSEKQYLIMWAVSNCARCIALQEFFIMQK